MLIFAIDDEPKALLQLGKAVREAVPEAQVMEFSRAGAAIRTVEEKGLRPDVIFSDIQMPGLSGLEMAVRFKTILPGTKIVFVTGYDHFALEAWRIHAGGYLMKPVDAGQIREEMEHLILSGLVFSGSPDGKPGEKLQVQCFGRFEVFWRGEPLVFERHQTKELFAFLIDARGARCSVEETVMALWEAETDLQKAKHRLRNLIGDLKKTLHGIGMDAVLIRSSGQAAINPDLVDCDYYRMLEGDMQAVNAYYGEYMEQYSWAELTKGKLHFQHGGNS